MTPRFLMLSSAPALPAPGACRLQAGHGALAGQVTLQLGKGTADAIDEQAFGRRRIDHVAETFEPDTALLQRFDQLEERDSPAPQPVQLPHHQCVPGPQKGQRLLQAGAGVRAAHLIR